MKIGRQEHHSSAISTSNEDTILVRGRDLARELVGSISFTEHFWLLLTGALPSAAQRRVLDATLVAIAEHGLVPSVQASRMTLAAAPEALQGAVAAGILGCGSVVLGSAEAAGRFFAEIAAQIGAGAAAGGRRHAGGARRTARPSAPFPATVTRCTRAPIRAPSGCSRWRAKPASPGATSRSPRRSSGCCRSSSAGRWRSMSPAPSRRCCSMPAIPLLALKGVPLLARTAGLVAHLLEEQQRPIGFVHVARRRRGRSTTTARRRRTSPRDEEG